MRFPQLFGHIDICNKINLDWVHMICCGLHRDDIHLHSGKTAVFYMHKLLLYEVGTEKRQSLNFSRQIPIYISLSPTLPPLSISLFFPSLSLSRSLSSPLSPSFSLFISRSVIASRSSYYVTSILFLCIYHTHGRSLKITHCSSCI